MTTILGKLQKNLANAAFDGLMICARHNRLYASGFSSSAGVLLVTPGACLFITDFRYFEAASRISGLSVAQMDNDVSYEAIASRFLAEHGVTSLGYEEDWLTCEAFEKWRKALPAEFLPAGAFLRDARSVKAPEEIEKIRKAQKIGEKAFSEVLPLIKPGVTEQEIAAELIYRMYRAGAEGLSFAPIVVSGANGALPHGVPSDKRIQAGEFVTMDFGCVREGYCSDMTRTVAVGHADGEMQKVYATVLAAQKAGIAAIKAGVSGVAADRAARDVIEQAGYGRCFGHGFGHGVGVEIHEAPKLSVESTDLLAAGQVVSAEPGIYLPSRMGVRIEDLVAVTEDGCENLTEAEKELIILG